MPCFCVVQHAAVQYILDSVIETLEKDPAKRFTYVEQVSEPSPPPTGSLVFAWQCLSSAILDAVHGARRSSRGGGTSRARRSRPASGSWWPTSSWCSRMSWGRMSRRT